MGFFSKLKKATRSVTKSVTKAVASVNPFYKVGGNGNDNFSIYGAGAAYGNGGNDTLQAYALYVKLDGGDGSDTIRSHSGGSDIVGGSGNDNIEAWGLSNSIKAGAGEDTIKAYAARNVIDAGTGYDTIYTRGGSNVINANGDGLADQIEALGGLNTIKTGDGSDKITAGGLGNVIVAGSGSNAISALGGANVVTTGAGSDDIKVAGGLNVIVSGSGNDKVHARGGLNAVYTSGGNNQIFGAGGGNAFVKTGDGTDQMYAIGGLNALAKVGHGDTTLLSGGLYNAQAKVGRGTDTFASLGKGNLLTKVGDGSSVMLSGGMYNISTSWGNSQDLLASIGLYNAAIGGAGNDKLFLAGKGNLIFGDSLGVSLDKFKLPGSQSAGSQAKTGDQPVKWQDLIKNVDATLDVTGNDWIVSAGLYNGVVAGRGSDIVITLGKNNITVGDNLNEVVELGIDLVNNIDFSSASSSIGSSLNFPNFSSLSLPKVDFSKLDLPEISFNSLPNFKDMKFDSNSIKNMLSQIGLGGLQLPSIDLSDFSVDFGSWKFEDTLVTIGQSNISHAGTGDDLLVAISPSIANDKSSDNGLSANEQKDILNSDKKMSSTSKSKLTNKGFNILMGGDGNDFVVGLGKYNLLQGNQGDDTLWAANLPTISLSANQPDVKDTLEAVKSTSEKIKSTIGKAKSVIQASRRSNALLGFLRTANISDLIQDSLEDSNANILLGGDGNDDIWVKGQGNAINAGSGNDTISSSGKGNIIFAGDGNDFIETSDFSILNVIDAGSGDDIISIAGAGTTVSAGDGDDIIGFSSSMMNSSLISTINGGSGNDTYVIDVSSESFQLADISSSVYIDNKGDNQTTDTLLFGGDLTLDDLQFREIPSAAGNSLGIGIKETGRQIILQQWFSDDRGRIDEFQFETGANLKGSALWETVNSLL